MLVARGRGFRFTALCGLGAILATGSSAAAPSGSASHAAAAASRPIVYVNSYATYSVRPDGTGWRRLNECYLNPIAASGRQLIGGFSHVADRAAPLVALPAAKEVINECDSGPRDPSVLRHRVLVKGSRVTSWHTLAWSPDGRRIVGVGTVGSGALAPPRVVVFNANGSGYRVVTTHALDGVSSSALDAVWSPRGDRIVFGRLFKSSDCPEFVETKTVAIGCDRSELAVVGADGSGARSIYRPLQVDPDEVDDLPIASPLRKLPSVLLSPFGWWGDQIFVRVSDTSQTGTNAPDRIAVVNVDGTGFRYLTSRGAHIRRPALSPDGKQIAFIAQQADKPSALYVMSSAAGSLRQVRIRQPLTSATCSRGSLPGRKTCTQTNLGFDHVAW